jgi:hypothetical protein
MKHGFNNEETKEQSYSDIPALCCFAALLFNPIRHPQPSILASCSSAVELRRQGA